MNLEEHLKLFNIFHFKSFDEIENFAYANWPKPTKREIKSQHAGLPVLEGEKYAFNLWFRENEFKK